MTPIQQLMLGVGAKKKTYMDDVFSTYLYKGTGSGSYAINNGLNLSSEGGLVWIKSRTNTASNILQDTVNGTGKFIKSNSNDGTTNTSQYITSFNNNGYTLGTDNDINNSSQNFASWSFRKAPGFFDVVEWDGNGSSGRGISHSLGCVPGLIMIKETTGSTDAQQWMVYHKSKGSGGYGVLSSNAAWVASNFLDDGIDPTSTTFYLSGHDYVNGSSKSYIAYLFAGGESAAATARSVKFNGSSDYLSLPIDSDLDLGTSDFTFETWVYPEAVSSSVNQWVFSTNSDDFQVYLNNVGGTTNKVIVHGETGTGLGGSIFLNSIESPATAFINQWHHIAVTRSSNVFRLYLNGIKFHESTSSLGFGSHGSTNPTIGRYSASANYFFDGKISNLRLVKGTAVYTSSFRVPTEPLTNITNTKLLCCNNSSTTGSTVTPGTITAHSGPIAKTDSPFDDPAAFTFGDSKEGIVKCGSYVGNGSSTGPEIILGWEPQFLLWKNINAAENWRMVDSMRGIVTGGNDTKLYPSTNDAEGSSQTLDLTPTGFKVMETDGSVNGNGNTIIYMAIRRPDGYVGKQYGAGEGTSVFAMDTGNGSATIPTFDSGFPVDFGMKRTIASSDSWITTARLTQGKYLVADTTAQQASYSHATFDSNTGFLKSSDASTVQAWMWKRHAGMDVVTYTGNGATQAEGGQQIKHSLSKTPEMIWLKYRNDTYDWQVYHKGLNGGTTPQNYKLQLNDEAAESGNAAWWNNTAPTSTHFTVGDSTKVNYNNGTYIAMLFASVSGISKVGYYTGTGSTQTITTGFQPRFVVIRRTDAGQYWIVMDTTRGWASGNDQTLIFNEGDAQTSYNDLGAPTSTGFTLTSNLNNSNASSGKYIYYAHA